MLYSMKHSLRSLPRDFHLDMASLVRIETPTSSLECDIYSNPGIAGQRGCIILHPWAKLGGSMDDPTVSTLYRAAINSGMFSTVCRYNMRGAGGSTRKWNKNIFIDPDVQDMLAVAQHILKAATDPPKQLFMIGYSYGSCVAANALEQVPEVIGYVAIGFPLGGMANLALRSREHWALLAESGVPKLVVQGTRDKFTALTTLREYAAQYHEHEPQPGSLDLQVIDGADHFFEGLYEDVAEKVMAWVQKQIDGHHHGVA